MVNPVIIDVLGYAGGTIIALSAPSQLYKSWKTQSTRDIAWTLMCLYITGIYLLYIYAHLADIMPVWIPCTIEVTSSTLLFMLKFKLDYLDSVTYVKESSTQTKDKDKDKDKDNDNDKGERDGEGEGDEERVLVACAANWNADPSARTSYSAKGVGVGGVGVEMIEAVPGSDV
jgi:uncharacterized protein with PQ loop repeat